MKKPKFLVFKNSNIKNEVVDEDKFSYIIKSKHDKHSHSKISKTTKDIKFIIY